MDKFNPRSVLNPQPLQSAARGKAALEKCSRSFPLTTAPSTVLLLLATAFGAGLVKADSPELGSPTRSAEAGTEGVIRGASDNVIVLDEAGARHDVDVLNVAVDKANRTVSIEMADSSLETLRVLARESWLRGVVPRPGFADLRFVRTTYDRDSWFAVGVPDPTGGVTIDIREFRPELERAWFTFGSPDSVALERPMFVSLAEVPRVEWERVQRSNANGTWTEERPMPINRLGINFTDADGNGQTVTVSRAWLGTYGLTGPLFRHGDGTSIANANDETYFYLAPTHFSIIYVFTTDEDFVKEDNGPFSNVYWSSAERNIYVLSDRRDQSGIDERLVSPPPRLTYDDTTSFTVRATWWTTHQGNWQLAVPILFMGANNGQVNMANSVHVIYASRDSNLGWLPWYYLRFVDSAGVLRVDHIIQNAPVNAELQFMLDYDGYSRTMTIALYEIDGTGVQTLGSKTYVLPSSVKFNIGKVGASAWGASNTYEPVTIARVDKIYFDANAARNGNFEVDENGDDIPDNWQKWIWSTGPGYQSSTRQKFGSYSARITDSSYWASYGLQTVRMPVIPGQTFVGSTWVWVSSGQFDLYLEFWTTQSYGTRLAVVYEQTTTTGQWEYLDIMLTAPDGAYWVDLLLYSGGSNTGTAYFDGAELHLRRSFWSINVHDGDIDWHLAFDRAAELGVSHVRTDLRWDRFERDYDGDWDTAYINYWRDIIRMGKTHGIDLIVILNGPKPSWVTDSAKYSEFGEFCQKVAEEYGPDIYYYQILNEHNWNAEITGDLPTFASSCYSGLLAGGGVSGVDHKSAFRTIVNVFANTEGWDPELRGWLDDAGYAIDIPAIDHYPMTYTASGCDDWAPLDALFVIMDDYSKEGAIMETGYSSYRTWWNPAVDEAAQALWISCALPVIRDKVETHNSANPGIPLLLGNLYELVDSNSNNWIPLPPWIIWDHFGLLRSDNFAEKLAYPTFRAQVTVYSL